MLFQATLVSVSGRPVIWCTNQGKEELAPLCMEEWLFWKLLIKMGPGYQLCRSTIIGDFVNCNLYVIAEHFILCTILVTYERIRSGNLKWNIRKQAGSWVLTDLKPSAQPCVPSFPSHPLYWLNSMALIKDHGRHGGRSWKLKDHIFNHKKRSRKWTGPEAGF